MLQVHYFAFFLKRSGQRPRSRRIFPGFTTGRALFSVVKNNRLCYKAVMEKIPMDTGEGCGPEIEYPCLWQYKVITTDTVRVREIISDHLGDAPYSLSTANTSSSGKYVSMNLELTVNSDYHRLRIYEVLTSHSVVKMVL